MARQPQRVRFFIFRSWRRIFILVILLLVLIIIAKHLPSASDTPGNGGVQRSAAKHGSSVPPGGENSHYLLPDEAVPHVDETLQVIPETFSGADKCPACLGKDLCESVEHGKIRIAFPELPNIASQQGVYYGKFHDRQVVVYKVGVQDNRWQQYEQYLCTNTTKSKSCDISKNVVNSFAATVQAFQPEHVEGAYVVAHKEPADLQFAVCVSKSFMEAIMDQTGLTDTEYGWSRETAAMVYTSMVVSQEVLLLKTASMFLKPRPFPVLLGTCGQLMILDHQGVPLETYLSATWEKRASLALQLFNIIDLFANGDVAWYVMYTDFRFENFDVTSEERVVVMDFESMIIIEKASTAQYDDTTSEEPCNGPCYNSFIMELMDSSYLDRRRLCSHAPRVVTEAMSARLCQYILSDLPEHQDVDDEEADEGGAAQPRGLLHSPPDQHKQELSDLLLECVNEAVAGSRQQAVEDLTDILQQYAGEKKEDGEEEKQ